MYVKKKSPPPEEFIVRIVSPSRLATQQRVKRTVGVFTKDEAVAEVRRRIPRNWRVTRVWRVRGTAVRHRGRWRDPVVRR